MVSKNKVITYFFNLTIFWSELWNFLLCNTSFISFFEKQKTVVWFFRLVSNRFFELWIFWSINAFQLSSFIEIFRLFIKEENTFIMIVSFALMSKAGIGSLFSTFVWKYLILNFWTTFTGVQVKLALLLVIGRIMKLWKQFISFFWLLWG